jgi:2-keto-4-pentenoate hydratase/2-oxohepta-3-ene-1,7-dioic acid hydratase in catechol pathway
MQLVTFERQGQRRWGARRGPDLVDLRAASPSLPPDLRSLLEGGEAALEQARAALDAAPEEAVYAASEVTLKAPLLNPEKIVCLGLNYADHAAESQMKLPEAPVLFSKYASALIGPDEPIVLPPTSQEVDYEAELVVVIGKRGRNIPVEAAWDYVAGYTIGHDVSARDYQLRKGGGQWMIGKTFDTFAPIGPALFTKDEVPDPHNLDIRCRLNGEVMQDSNTKYLIFRIPNILAYLSHVFTLVPGDVIFTGTPSGVGFVREPPVYLKPGDVVEVEIEGLGVLRNPVVGG